MDNEKFNILALIEHERRLVATLIRKGMDLMAYEYVNEHPFLNDTLKQVFTVAYDYRKKYDKSITQAVFQDYLNSKDGIEKTALEEAVKSVFESAPFPDEEYFHNTLNEHGRYKKVTQAILSSLEPIKNGDSESAEKILYEAFRDTASSSSSILFSDIDTWGNGQNRNTITTGWKLLDEKLSGGLASGELGVVVGSSGAGKSWMLSALGLAAARAGKKVLHLTLELGASYSMNRYASLLTGINPNDVRNQLDIVRKKQAEISGEIRMIDFAELATLPRIDALVRMYKPDILIVDYADLISSNKYRGDKYLEAGETYRELRQLAMLYKIPIWTASQANRGGKERDFITDIDIADSYKKVMVSDFVMSIFRSGEDKKNNLASFTIMKSRFASDGFKFKSVCDFSRGILRVEELTKEQRTPKRSSPLDKYLETNTN